MRESPRPEPLRAALSASPRVRQPGTCPGAIPRPIAQACRMTTFAHPATPSHRRARPSARLLPRLSRRAGFWAVAFAFLALTAFATAPSALYGLYAQREHLAPITLTVVYAVYAVGIVSSLLLAGHRSDIYGRRAGLVPSPLLAAAAA